MCPRLSGLRDRQPVAIQVEEIMVGPAARPGLCVLGRIGIRIRLAAGAQFVVADKPVTSVRILQRIDHDNRVLQNRVHFPVIPRRKQMIGQLQCRVRRGNLIAMHPVSEPDHHRKRRLDPLRDRFAGASRIGQFVDAVSNLVKPSDVRWRPDRGVNQSAPLPGLPVIPQLHPLWRCRGQPLHVANDLRS